jgi:glutathione synthase/RimK-type ligase-like ATP-grasp enzyme
MQAQEIVVKPTQSAGAWRTLRINRDNAVDHEAELGEWRAKQTFLAQAFMPEIVSEGEWSLVFFDGEYSHSLLKRAKHGDFRVQSDHGGTVEAQTATLAMQDQAQSILRSLKAMPLYARVDGVIRDGQFMLMELELIEPELFLEVDTRAAARFASAIQARLTRS